VSVAAVERCITVETESAKPSNARWVCNDTIGVRLDKGNTVRHPINGVGWHPSAAILRWFERRRFDHQPNKVAGQLDDEL
jgi:hypothetical protein